MVSTFVTRQFTLQRAALIGMMWGLGHTLTIFLVGSAIILFGVVIPPRLGLSMEFTVALMLTLLGMLNLTGIMRKINQRLSRTPEPSGAMAASSVSGEERAGGRRGLIGNTISRFGLYQCVRPLAVDTVHGLAGSAAVALLVLSTIRSPIWATAYLLVFGAGTMVGMMLMTAAMAIPAAYSGKRFSRLSQHLTVASGLVSVGFGSFLRISDRISGRTVLRQSAMDSALRRSIAFDRTIVAGVIGLNSVRASGPYPGVASADVVALREAEALCRRGL